MKNKYYRAILILAFGAIIFISYFLLDSKNFEEVPPEVKIVISNNNSEETLQDYLNPNYSLKLQAFDASGIREYSIEILKNGQKVYDKNGILVKKSQWLDITLPKFDTSSKNKTLEDKINALNEDKITLNVAIKDWSNANFFRGNQKKITKEFLINSDMPKVNIIATSTSIKRGGSMLVAFTVDSKIKIKKISLNNGSNEFKVYKYKNANGKDVFLSFIAWSIKSNFFDPKIKITDFALNQVSEEIPINRILRPFRQRNIIISDSFLEKIGEKLNIPNENTDNLEKFRFLNDIIKKEDNDKVKKYSKNSPIEFDNFPKINVFSPIKNSSIVAYYGDERLFFYKKKKVGTSTHLGLDLIGKNKNVDIINSNYGFIIFKDTLHSYGNVVSIIHPLDIVSLYAHLLKLPDDIEIQENAIFAKSGNTGFSFGDHLHFGILINGVFVNPFDWTDPEWINKNITEVLEKAYNF